MLFQGKSKNGRLNYSKATSAKNMIFSKKVIFETQFTRFCVSWKTHASFLGHSNLRIPSFLMSINSISTRRRVHL